MTLPDRTGLPMRSMNLPRFTVAAKRTGLTLILVLGLMGWPQQRAMAAVAGPSDAVQSVVSVLPVWPGRPQGGQNARRGTAPEGSGVVLRPGIIATAWHVVEPARRIDVRLSDGRILPARLMGQDAASDIALLQVEADLQPMVIADNTTLAERACAIGNAFGLGLSITCGVVSAQNVSNAGFNRIEDFVQTDAAANPGVSGGALVNAEGQLIGMVSAIFASEGDTNTGINFAVSTELLLRVADALIETESVQYPSAGWRLQPGSRAQLQERAAPVVAAVGADGPAARAGIASGDVIIEIGTRRITSPRDAIAALAILPQDISSVGIVYSRQGDERQATLYFAETADRAEPRRPAAANDNAPASDTEPSETPRAESNAVACPHPPAVCRVRQAIFPVSSYDPIASATRIGPRLLVTNRHVVANRDQVTVHTPSGPLTARVIPSGYEGDLVLLEVGGLPEQGFIPPLDGEPSGEPLSSRDPFYAVGADVSRQLVRVFAPGGLIASPAADAVLGRIHVTARMQPGVSGGALVDGSGALVGIAVGGGEARFEAIPLAQVRALVAQRQDVDASSVTKRLGSSFVECAARLDALPARDAGQDLLDDLGSVCAMAMNSGQLLAAGRALSRAGDFDGAIALHGQAATQVPNSINARISLLVSLQLAGRFETMTSHARAVMAMAPDDPQILRFAIQSGVWGGAPELSEKAYEALLSADPRQAEAARRFIDNAPPAPPPR
jgi:S1-C subfamily serine protease